MVRTARDLLASRGGKPRQSNLRRATSTAYYAMFHCLAKSGADLLVGGSGANRSEPAWTQVYRALKHGSTKNACRNQTVLKSFPKAVEDFANAFTSMQEKRHRADYDPSERFYKSAVERDLADVESAITRFQKAPIKDRRAFVAFVLFRKRT